MCSFCTPNHMVFLPFDTLTLVVCQFNLMRKPQRLNKIFHVTHIKSLSATKQIVVYFLNLFNEIFISKKCTSIPDWPSFTASVIYIKCYYSEVFNTFHICRLHTVLRNSTASRRAKTKVWSEMGTWIFSQISYHPPLMQTWIWWEWFSLHCVTQS